MAIAGDFGTPVRLDTSGVVLGRQGLLIGFLCVNSGTLTLYDHASSASGTPFLNAFPVTAGQFVPIAVSLQNGCYATLITATGTFVAVPLL